MGRCLAAALVLLTSMPTLADAQIVRVGTEEAFAPGRIMVAPFAGYRYRYAATLDQVVEVFGEQTFLAQRIEVDAAPVVGAALSVPLTGRFAVVGSAAYGFAGSSQTITFSSEGSNASFSPEGGTFLFAKAGFSYQFLDTSPENAMRRVAATASVAPALVRIDPPGAQADLTSDDAINHFGFAVSANGIIPLRPWPSLALDLGLEDFVTFWNTGEIASRFARDVGTELGTTVRTEVDADPTNIVMAHVGLRIRF